MGRRSRTLILLLLSLVLGFALRFVRIGQPYWVVKYCGSLFWAMAIFWLAAFVFVRLRGVKLVLLSFTIAAGIEFLKLVHCSWLESLRGTMFGLLVLGRYFAWTDLLVYALAIVVAAFLERRFLSPTN